MFDVTSEQLSFNEIYGLDALNPQYEEVDRASVTNARRHDRWDSSDDLNNFSSDGRTEFTAELRPYSSWEFSFGYQSNQKRGAALEPNSGSSTSARKLSNCHIDWSSRLDSKVKEFISLYENWDGDGAEEIPMGAVYSTLNFLSELRNRFVAREPTGVAPSPDGEIVVYWNGLSEYAEINFDGSEGLSMCWGFNDDELQFVKDNIKNISSPGTSGIWEALSKFFGQNHVLRENPVQEVL